MKARTIAPVPMPRMIPRGRRLCLLSILGAASILVDPASAEPLPSYTVSIDFTGNSGDEASVVIDDPHPYFSQISVTRSDDLDPAALADGFGAANWPATGTIDLDRYIEITLEAEPGVEYTIEDIELRTFTDQSSWEWTLAHTGGSGFSESWSVVGAGTDVHTESPLLTSLTGAHSFRLYGASYSGFAAVAGLMSGSPAVVITGGAIPEPKTTGLVALAILGLTTFYRGRRSRV